MRLGRGGRVNSDTIAHVIVALQRLTLILAHRKNPSFHICWELLIKLTLAQQDSLDSSHHFVDDVLWHALFERGIPCSPV